MKRLNKFLALALAATMACSFTGAAALAEDAVQNEQEGSGETGQGEGGGTSSSNTSTMGYIQGSSLLPVEKVLVMAKNSPVPDVSFKFKISGLAVTANTMVENMPLKTGLSIDDTTTTDVDENIISVTMDDEGYEWYDQASVPGLTGVITGVTQTANFDLSKANFTEAGVYRYLVEEVNTGVSYISSYDSSKFIVDVYVGADGKDDDDNPVYSVKYIKGYKATENGTGVDTTYTVGDKSPIIFKNTMSTTTLEIRKDAYDYMNENLAFDFWIKIPTGGDTMILNEGDTFDSALIDGNTKTDMGELIKVGGTDKVKKEGASTYTYLDAAAETPDEDHGWCHFQLKAGQSLEIYNVPVNMIYFLYEQPTKGFDCYYEVSNGTTEPTVWSSTNADYKPSTNGVIDNGINRLTITPNNNIVSVFNNREFTDSGIRVDILPYAVIVLAAAAACVVLVVSKKKRNAR
jgi:hypothetical protein